VEVPLGAVARIHRGRHGRNDSILVVATEDGDEHRFLVDLDEWLPAFTDALSLLPGDDPATGGPTTA
jgi:hypothetical protein